MASGAWQGLGQGHVIQVLLGGRRAGIVSQVVGRGLILHALSLAVRFIAVVGDIGVTSTVVH